MSATVQARFPLLPC